MTDPLLNALLLLTSCGCIGALPLIAWLVRGLSGKQVRELGTGNISVSAAFYHGGQTIGILAVLSEALKGIAAVLLARSLFPHQSAWEIWALMALVLGRYGFGKGAGTTNVVWGFIWHDWQTALLVGIIGGIGFTLLRERQAGKQSILVLLPIITALRHPGAGGSIAAVALLSLLMAWIYQTIPDDLDLSSQAAQPESRRMFRFFRGDRALLTLDQPLTAAQLAQVGNKAATLSALKQAGYPVPAGWVLPAGDDPEPLVSALHPTPDQPLIVRSSAVDEDSETASAAGQYLSIAQVTDRAGLLQAILACQASYDRATAVQYRQDQKRPDKRLDQKRAAPETAAGMAVLIQQQVAGQFAGVAFSRDPVTQQPIVLVEAVAGSASQVVSGQVTPQQYRVSVPELTIDRSAPADWQLSADPTGQTAIAVTGTGDLPLQLVQQVAYLVRHLEARFYGVPQDIEWSYDGDRLWLLQARPITTLLPIWTRKIAAEVIPGWIHPLTWSINRPLTCGVWGDLFTLVLGDRARGLDFNEMATLHHSAAYFNASLLNQTFRQMGLPPESLEFLTRGAKFSKPSLRSTLRNLPGLLRLLRRELRLIQDFQQSDRQTFRPSLASLTATPPARLSATQLGDRIEQILQLLQQATYFSILAPLSAALRQALFKVSPAELNYSRSPEVAALQALQALADARDPRDPVDLTPFLASFGYLSEVGTDIAVPTWQEDPQMVATLLAGLGDRNSTSRDSASRDAARQAPAALSPRSANLRRVQPRIDLKGQVTEVYSKLLAELRWSFVALEQLWLQDGSLDQAGDIFFLTYAEIQAHLVQPQQPWVIQPPIADRRRQLEHDRQLVPPLLVYGNAPPVPLAAKDWTSASLGESVLQGIGASPGEVEGIVRVVLRGQAEGITPETILVVPYTDSGWAPLLSQAGGIVAEVGGQLSHGAIVAREYGIPAVMDIAQATQRLQTGQRIRINGWQGTIELLPS